MDAVDEIKQRLSIEDVVGEYVELKRAGRNFKGLSPFGNERSPSFMVSPEKQIWHDFSSGKGGNVFSFVMEMEGLDFKAALELLARKAGVDLAQYRSGGKDNTKQKERLLEALEAATHFYQVQFSKHQQALEYVFKKREFTKEIALAFKIGYSPNSQDGLVKFLTGKGFSEAEIKAAGLGTKRYNGFGDMFRGRIMIPLMDPVGKVIGFTARILEDDPNAPKYINTPQTILYDKSRHVFGLHLAKDAIRKAGYTVVAEGNLDVIASHQAGVKQVVATAGTAVTEMHLKTIGRFSGDVRLAFDQDKAGLSATERAIPIAGKAGVTLSIITVPEGKDPDELIRKSPELWQKAIDTKQYALDWLIERYSAQLDITSATGKRQFSDILLAVVRQLPDAVEQDHYVSRIAELIGASKEALESKLKGIKTNIAPKKHKAEAVAPFNRQSADQIKLQNHLLSLTLMRPNLRDVVKNLKEDMFMADDARTLFIFLRDHPDFDGKPQEVKALKNIGDYVKMLVLLYEELYQDLELLELQYEVARLQVRLIEQYVKFKKTALIESMQGASEAETQKYLEQVRELDALLKLSTEGGAHA